jgi:hypothetical protein
LFYYNYHEDFHKLIAWFGVGQFVSCSSCPVLVG